MFEHKVYPLSKMGRQKKEGKQESSRGVHLSEWGVNKRQYVCWQVAEKNALYPRPPTSGSPRGVGVRDWVAEGGAGAKEGIPILTGMADTPQPRTP